MPITKATLHYHSNTPDFSATPEESKSLKELTTSFSSDFTVTQSAQIKFVQAQFQEFSTIRALNLHFPNNMDSERVAKTLKELFPIQSPSLQIDHLTIYSAKLRPDVFIQFIQDRFILSNGICSCDEIQTPVL